jgi:hypothetical protein
MPTNRNIICTSYLMLSAAAPQYQNQNKWLCNETLFQILNTHYPNLKTTFNFTRGGLSHALNDKAGPFSGSNEVCLFAKTFQTLCPYTGKKRSVGFYYRHVGDGKCPTDPAQGYDNAKELLAKTNKLQRDCIRVGSNIINTPATNTEDDANRNNNTTKRACKKIIMEPQMISHLPEKIRRHI